MNNSPYRQQDLIPPDPVGHPILDQVQGILLDPGCKVVVYKFQYGNWEGEHKIVVRCTRTHLEYQCPILNSVKIVEWGKTNRWLAG